MRAKDVRTFLIVAAVASVATMAMGNVRTFIGSQGHSLAIDFSIFHFAGLLLWQGDIATIFDVKSFITAHTVYQQAPLDFSPFPYPPNALWFIAPLALLPEMLAMPLWSGLTFAAFAWPLSRHTDRPRAALLALLAAPGSLVNVSVGQNGFLSGALLGGGLMCLERRPILAGCLFGLLSYKPQLGVLLPFVLLAGRHYRVFAVAVVVSLGTIGASVLAFGTTPWLEYFNGAAAIQRNFLEHGMGPAILTNPSVFVAGRILDLPIVADYALQAIVAILVIASCVIAFARKAGTTELRAALVMVGTFLVTPYGSSYDMSIVAAAQILAFSRSEPKVARGVLLHALVWLLPILMFPLGLAHLPIAPFALGALFALLLRRILSASTRIDPVAVRPAP